MIFSIQSNRWQNDIKESCVCLCLRCMVCANLQITRLTSREISLEELTYDSLHPREEFLV